MTVYAKMGVFGVGCGRETADMSVHAWGKVNVYWNPIASKGAVSLHGILGGW